MMLEIRNVRKAFGSLEVLKGVDLRVEQGDVAAIQRFRQDHAAALHQLPGDGRRGDHDL